jgi:hypothetical protein
MAIVGALTLAVTLWAGLCTCLPSSMLVVRRRYITKDGSPTRCPALLWSFRSTPRPRGPPAGSKGRFCPVSSGCPCRVSARAGEAIIRGSQVSHIFFWGSPGRCRCARRATRLRNTFAHGDWTTLNEQLKSVSLRACFEAVARIFQCIEEFPWQSAWGNLSS